jgi:hypothetical protein
VRSSSGKGSGPTSTAALGSLAAFTITTPPPQSGAPSRPGCQIHHVCTLHPGNAIDYIFQSTPWRPNSLLSPWTLSAYKRLFAPVALLSSPGPNPDLLRQCRLSLSCPVPPSVYAALKMFSPPSVVNATRLAAFAPHATSLAEMAFLTGSDQLLEALVYCCTETLPDPAAARNWPV